MKENQRDLVGGGTHVPALASAEQRARKKQDEAQETRPLYKKS
jgi:hypothetical protein